MNRFDVIVFGLGGMGSSAAHRLAERGQRVLGLERFAPGHDKGSSHGRTRMIRQAYFEDPCYVPLLWRAYELWRDLERAGGQTLLTVTGGIVLGLPDSEVVTGTLRSARQYDLPHEYLDAGQIRTRFPVLTPADDTVGVYEERAGFVAPDTAQTVMHGLATRAGAMLRFNERVVDWHATSGGGVRVTTISDTYEAGQLVIAAGPWIQDLPLQVERKVMFWFEPTCGLEPFALGKFVVWGWELEDGTFIYGFPATDGPAGGVKVAVHREIPVVSCNPDAIDRQVREEEIALMRKRLATRLPALNARCVATTTCMYTNAPDGHFILDRHPQQEQVLLVSACSGHGFKFAPIIGEVVADLVTTGSTRHDIDRFRLSRL
jgi:sarcosine oxidase